VCGASAVVAALSVSGFDVSKYSFLGFLPRSKGDMLKWLAGVLPGTTVFYESPKRITATLGVIGEKYPDARLCLCNDLTKKFERVYHGQIGDVLQQLADNENAGKGEYTCVVHVGETPQEPMEAAEALPSPESQLVDIMIKTGGTLKDAGAALKAAREDLNKKAIYAAMLNLKNLFETDEDDHDE
jgi:16S rRNA (cytidine1402-2'-O)-methyltransferase